MIFRFLQRLLRIFIAIFYRVRVFGLNNFPKEGALILCANHTFVKDLIFIGSAAPRKIFWMAKAELFKIPLFGPLIKALGAFPVNRGARDRDSVKVVYNVLRSGAPLGIFPEGTRVKDAKERPPFRRGFVSFAANTGAAILPVSLNYKGGPFGRGRLFSHTDLSFGEPITLETGRKYAREELDGISASIMNWIYSNL